MTYLIVCIIAIATVAFSIGYNIGINSNIMNYDDIDLGEGDNIEENVK